MMNLEFTAKENYRASENSILEIFSVEELLDKLGYKSSELAYFSKTAAISSGGWQSWSPSFETFPNKKQLSGADCILQKMRCLLDFPETRFKSTKNQLLCPFICYFRKDDFYLVLASTGSVIPMENSGNEKPLPPVQFIVNRKEGKVLLEIADKGKNWQKDELQSKITIFTANSYFEMKDTIKSIFDCVQFKQIEFLGRKALGWESWYNHYTEIDEKIIEDDLLSLSKKETVLSKLQKDAPIIFQIDDGWETSVGDWTIHKEKFPNGLKTLATQIEEKGYIPGLWIAPFLLYEQSPVAIEHPEWLLRNEKGKPVCSGVNPGWNGLKPLCCLDLSRDDVLSYLDSVMETAIEDWGFRYLKLDFMYAGMLYGKFYNGGAAYEWYANALKILTKRKFTRSGKPVAYLGCGIPMEQSYHDFPLSRIGCDTYEHWYNKPLHFIRWAGRNEAYMNLKDTLGRAHWDKAIYANDPDVIFIREKNCSLTQDEKILIALTDSIFASQIMYSDDPSDEASETELTLTEKICTLCKKYENEEFSVQEKEEDFYEIKSRNGNYFGTIDLRKGTPHKITIEG